MSFQHDVAVSTLWELHDSSWCSMGKRVEGDTVTLFLGEKSIDDYDDESRLEDVTVIIGDKVSLEFKLDKSKDTEFSYTKSRAGGDEIVTKIVHYLKAIR